MKIDAFAHVLPPRYLEERNRRAGDRFTSQYKKYSSAVPALSNLETRFRVMDQFPDVQQLLTIAGPNIESITEPRDTVEIARIANDELAKLVSDHPARFVGAVTCMPMNDVDAALHEAERCIDELGFHGVEIFTDINGKPLDSAEFFPLYEMMETNGLPIILHPRRTNTTPDYPGEEKSKYLTYTNFGSPYVTSLAMARLAFGVFVKHPKLKVLTHHGGGLIPFFHKRAEFSWDLHETHIRFLEATVGGPAVYPEGARVVFPQHRGGLLETTARKYLVDGRAQVREEARACRRMALTKRGKRTAPRVAVSSSSWQRCSPQPDPTTSLLPARLIGVDDGAGPQRLHQGISGGLGTPGKTLHGTTQCGARHGETQHLLESQADLVVRHPADHLLERGEGEQPGPEMHRAHLERLRNQQRMLATDTPTTLLAVAMTHYELPGLGLDGRNVDLVQIDAPFRSYLTSARALLRARSLEGLVGNWDRSDGLPPVLRPRLASGLLRVPFRLVLGEGCGLALASAP